MEPQWRAVRTLDYSQSELEKNSPKQRFFQRTEVHSDYSHRWVAYRTTYISCGAEEGGQRPYASDSRCAPLLGATLKISAFHATLPTNCHTFTMCHQ